MAKKTTHNNGAVPTTPWTLKSSVSSLLPLLSTLAAMVIISLAVLNTHRPQSYLSSFTAIDGGGGGGGGEDLAQKPSNSSSIKNDSRTADLAQKPSNSSSMKNDSRSPPPPTTCNLFDGRWVYDESTHPLYSGHGCSFIPDEVACDKYGRKDTGYQHWRWQPHGCDLPKFNGTKLLERLKGKRMVFIGDSLNRNKWASMVCLLESSIPAAHKSFDSIGSTISFKAKNYNALIDFYWSPLLLESNCDDREQHRIPDRIIRAPASIENHARHWADADILIFDSYVWWMKPGFKLKILHDNNVTYDEIEMIQGFELALKTWSNWLQFHMDTQKKQIYFVSLSPLHGWGPDWGAASGQNCYNETEPISKVGYRGMGTDPAMMRKADEAIKDLRDRGVNVDLLNITQLSDYRKDGHPSVYKKYWPPLSEEQLANPTAYSDCVHWCLPGVPDTWNELLYAYIFAKQDK